MQFCAKSKEARQSESQISGVATSRNHGKVTCFTWRRMLMPMFLRNCSCVTGPNVSAMRKETQSTLSVHRYRTGCGHTSKWAVLAETSVPRSIEQRAKAGSSRWKAGQLKQLPAFLIPSVTTTDETELNYCLFFVPRCLQQLFCHCTVVSKTSHVVVLMEAALPNRAIKLCTDFKSHGWLLSVGYCGPINDNSTH